jgi:hypothetical protein
MEFRQVCHLLPKAQKMETPRHQVEFPTGRLVLQSPCSVGREAFSPTGDGNKFCSKCTKVVHDMTRLSEAEIKALFLANAGNVCGSIRVQIPRPEPEPLPQSPSRKPLYIKQLAAAASIFLLYATSQAKPVSKLAIAWQTLVDLTGDKTLGDRVDPHKTNTLVTGVIMNQDSELVPLDIPVLIFSGKTLVAEVKTSNGLFRVDLVNKLKPDDVIEIVVRERSNTKTTVLEDTHGGGKAILRLGDAQNVVIKVDYDFRMMFDGGMGWEENEPPANFLDTEKSVTSPSQP